MRQVKETVHYFCNDTLFGHINGQGITTAVLDTGISPHPDLAGRIVAFGDILNGKKQMYDDNSHGTHVAGIIAGSGRMSSGLYAGIAPASKIVALKVLDQNGNGKIKVLIDGIKTILENREQWKIRIVNISIGTLPHYGDEEEAELIQWVDRMWDEGLVVVTAAGNFGPRKGTVTIPGISRKVITVGASDDGKQKDRYGKVGTNYSGRGPTPECICKPDLVAPGSYIRSCNRFINNRTQRLYTVKSGTSMSTPIVSGAVALLLSKYPDMKNVEVKLRLMMSAEDIGKEKNIQGRGILNIEKLLNPRL